MEEPSPAEFPHTQSMPRPGRAVRCRDCNQIKIKMKENWVQLHVAEPLAKCLSYTPHQGGAQRSHEKREVRPLALWTGVRIWLRCQKNSAISPFFSLSLSSFLFSRVAFAVLIYDVLQKTKAQNNSIHWHRAWKGDILHIYFSYIFKNICVMGFLHELLYVFGRATPLPLSWATTQGRSAFSSCWSFPQKDTPSEKHPLLRAVLNYSCSCQQELEKK